MDMDPAERGGVEWVSEFCPVTGSSHVRPREGPLRSKETLKDHREGPLTPRDLERALYDLGPRHTGPSQTANLVPRRRISVLDVLSFSPCAWNRDAEDVREASMRRMRPGIIIIIIILSEMIHSSVKSSMVAFHNSTSISSKFENGEEMIHTLADTHPYQTATGKTPPQNIQPHLLKNTQPYIKVDDTCC